LLKNIYLDNLYLCFYSVLKHTGGTMIHLHTMTKEEHDEFMRHHVLHDMAELVLQYGYDEIMSDLANILDNKLDKLEPI
jgi:hypothetical protein